MIDAPNPQESPAPTPPPAGSEPSPQVRRQLEALGLEVPEEILAAMGRYLDLLMEANQKFNLTAVRDREGAWQRHIVDSLTLLPALEELPDGTRIIDVGSGGGLPGIPVALACPHWQVTLVEATGKKARFLSQCVQKIPLPNVKVINKRAETIGQDKNHRERYDVALSRALGPLREMLEYTLPLLKLGGLLVAMKGPSVERELPDSSDALTQLGGGSVEVVEAYPPGQEQNTVLVLVRKEEPTPKEYPRAPGTPRQSPL